MRICLFGSGFIVGWTIWQCSIVAPTLSSALDAKMFSKVMRKLWPKFFLGNLTTGILSCFALFYEGNSPISNFCIPISTACLSFVCYTIIPIMNNASDSGNQRRFRVLHKFSVWSIVLKICTLPLTFVLCISFLYQSRVHTGTFILYMI
jgi:ABC-type transport system involved in cytochrome c biogenesis permease subunit